MLLPIACSNHSHVIRKKVTLRNARLVLPPKWSKSPFGLTQDKLPEKSEQTPSKEMSTEQSPPIVTIWIHGTLFFRRPLYYSFFESKPCIKKALDLDQGYKLRTIADTLHAAAPEQFPLEHYYLFGWSGKLNAHERECVATALHQELTALTASYKKTYGKTPFIQVISHSHGGNVVLNLIKIKQDKKTNFVINKLILLACPVQKKTVNYIKDQLFKKVYALYSSLDIVQIIAPQVIHKISQTKKGNLKSEYTVPAFSYRRFPKNEKIAQVKIRMNRRAMFHNEFNKPRFLALLPQIIQLIDIWNTQELRNIPITDKTQLLCLHTARHTVLYDAQ